MRIKDIMTEVHQIAVSKGWYDPPKPTSDGLLMIHSEVSEATEDLRVNKMQTTFRHDGKPEGFPSELADIVIRVFDTAEYLGIDLEREIRIKSDFNRTRPYRHGGKSL